jgi:hypothetical protein
VQVQQNRILKAGLSEGRFVTLSAKTGLNISPVAPRAAALLITLVLISFPEGAVTG